MAQLSLATCQFEIRTQVAKNLQAITRQMKQAKSKGAHLVHFSEACLTGYLGNELKSVREMDWDAVSAAMEEIKGLAGELGLWVVVGSNHRLSDKHKPHNSLYVVSDRGRLVNRYDKMFCTGDHDDDGDLHHYSPGQSFVTFQVQDVVCGLLICHDFRYPELFRQYKRLGVQLMLVSFHNAGGDLQTYRNYNTWVTTTIQAAAASNYYAVSANNGTRRHAWPSFVVNAQGMTVSRARPHRSAVLINRIDTEEMLYDASEAWRDRCLRGTYHSGTLIQDPRSRDRAGL
jgi:predicted amidohydrolase